MEHLEWDREDMDLHGVEGTITVDAAVDMGEGLEVEDDMGAAAKDGNLLWNA